MTTAFITGASRGIGLEFVRQYAEAGWNVLACCRRPGEAHQLSEIAARWQGRVRVCRLDVADQGQLHSLSSELEGEAIDLLINNAGIYGPRHDGFGSVDTGAWTEVMRVNTLAPLKVAEAFIEQVARSSRRLIVTISSLMGSISDNGSGGYYIYRASKAAVNMVNKSMAIDLRGRGITCVVLNPGWVKTDMGGPGADLAPRESVAGMRAVIESLKAEHSGRFFHHDGEELPW
jgi:NAD(P)-dependent dehydrogenase (short-subunit alcohol dehydrogenase family)